MVGANPLSGPLPLALAGLSLEVFGYADSDLCVPADASFRAWLNAIPVHEGTGVDCTGGNTDRDILVVLLQLRPDGPNWAEQHQLVDRRDRSGEWYGVDDRTAAGRVTQIRLVGQNFQHGARTSRPVGTDPAANWAASAAWSSLSLGANNSDGHHSRGNSAGWPTSEVLSLGVNTLTGAIPPELGGLANLRFLSVQGNNLTGAIPPEFGGLANLETLWLTTATS